MAINFPISPSPNQIYSYNGLSWQWNGSYWQSFPPSSGATGVVRTITASTGLSANTTTGDVSIVNNDKGSSQNIFKNIQIDNNQQFSASQNSDNLNFSGINITITSAATNTLVFSAGTVSSGGVTSIIGGSGISAIPSTGNVTVSYTGSTGGVSLGTVYTTGNNLNFI
jgi:hypothetical protein